MTNLTINYSSINTIGSRVLISGKQLYIIDVPTDNLECIEERYYPHRETLGICNVSITQNYKYAGGVAIRITITNKNEQVVMDKTYHLKHEIDLDNILTII